MLVLSNDEMARLLTMQDCMAALEPMYRDYVNSRTLLSPRFDNIMPNSHEGGYYAFKHMGGGWPAQGVQAQPQRHLPDPRLRRLVGADLWPPAGRPHERLLHDVLGQVEVVDPEDPRECRHHLARLAPEQMVHERVDVGSCHLRIAHPRVLQRYIFAIGRTSTCPPFSKIGQPFAMSVASFRSVAVTIR